MAITYFIGFLMVNVGDKCLGVYFDVLVNCLTPIGDREVLSRLD